MNKTQLTELLDRVSTARKSLFQINQRTLHDIDLPIHTDLDEVIPELYRAEGHLQCMLEYNITPAPIPCPHCKSD